MYNQIFGRRTRTASGSRELPIRNVRQRISHDAVTVSRRIMRRYLGGPQLIAISEVTFQHYDNDLSPATALFLLQQKLKEVVSAELAVHIRRIRRSDPRANPEFVGNVSLVNEDNGRYYSTKTIPIDDLDKIDLLDGAMEKIIQSNSAWTPQDMKLIWVYKREQLVGGAAVDSTKKRPNYIKPIFWKTYSDYLGEIPCAALSIAYYLQYYSFGTLPNDNNKRVTKAVLDKARQIADEMAWSGFVSIEEIGLFVIKNPQYRLTVFNNRIGSNDYSGSTWAGDDFDYDNLDDLDSPNPCENTIYIHLVGEMDHYVPVMYPGAYARKKNNRHWMFCQSCCTSYMGQTKHHCNDRRQKSIVCPYKCGRRHVSVKECDFFQCKHCSAIRSRDFDGTTHRCLPRKSRTPIEFNETCAQDEKKYQLYVWDIEARLDVETSTKSFNVFDVDENGLFQREAQVLSHDIRKQNPILVCVQNVFTGEKETFYGDDCMQRFLDMAITRDNGKNVFFAHNSSGYDSLMLIEECYKRPGLQMKNPLFRGNKLIK